MEKRILLDCAHLKWKIGLLQSFILALLLTQASYSQTSKAVNAKVQKSDPTILSTAGGINTFSEIQLEWTLGESFIGSSKNDKHFYTIGFHQPFISIEKESLEEFSAKTDINIFPNPVANKLNIKLSDEYFGDVSFVISDLLGRPIFKKNMDQNLKNSEIDFPDVPSGNYLLKFIDATGKPIKSFKIIKLN